MQLIHLFFLTSASDPWGGMNVVPVLLGDTSASVHQQPAQADAEILRFYTANWTYIWIKLTDNAPGFKFHGARQETAPRRATLKIPHSWMLHRNKHTNRIYIIVAQFFVIFGWQEPSLHAKRGAKLCVLSFCSCSLFDAWNKNIDHPQICQAPSSTITWTLESAKWEEMVFPPNWTWMNLKSSCHYGLKILLLAKNFIRHDPISGVPFLQETLKQPIPSIIDFFWSIVLLVLHLMESFLGK